MKVIKVQNNQAAGIEAANIIGQAIEQNPQIILGLATGSTPITTYENLVQKYNNHEIDFSQVKSFNLDEYKDLDANNDQSYRYFMNQHLFDHVNIKKENTVVPNTKDLTNPGDYDVMIDQAGGIDLQLLGLGVNGHIGFNEPGTSFDSITSIVDLSESTIEANQRFFAQKSDVPTQAISMGLQTIMKAKAIILIATGVNKADAIRQLIRGPVSNE